MLQENTCVSQCSVDWYKDSYSVCQKCAGTCLRFNPPYNATIQENATVGTLVLAMTVTDLRMTGRPLSFAIVGGLGTFLLLQNGSNSVLVVTGVALDRDTVPVHTFSVSAYDPGTNQSAFVSLSIFIGDINDNPPVFSQSNFTVYVADNQTVGSIIFTANATDTDFGQNGVVRYSLSPQSTLFSIDPVSGRVNITAQLISQVYVFNLTATDLGTPPFSSRATLTIVVMETNKPPVFLNSVYYIQVYENATIGTTVTQIQASDSGTGANGNVIYSILPPNPFGVDPRTGLVYLTSTLDYKTQRMYLLTVVATDAGVPPLSASASLNVTVLNVNKGPPVFSQSNFTVYVADNQTVGSIIFSANATDTDFGQNGVVRYSLSPQSTLFSIDPVSGGVNITAQLISQVYVFNLIATDLGTPPLLSRGTLTIVVTETNKPPVFLNAVYYIQVYENATIGTTVTQIQASDSGTGANGNVTYSILPPNPFGVDLRTGLVYLTSTLDYKTQKMYLLTVVATDAGVPPLSASASLNVTVLNVNKGPPVFSQSNFTVYVADNQTVGSIIFTANATDTDFGQNGVVHYSLSPQSTLFSIDPVSGGVNITAQLISQVYVFNLTATDLGTPPLSSRVNLTIVVMETNKPPVFLNAVYYIQVYENATIGTTVTQTQASDSGTGANGNVTYSIVPPNPFGVDPRSGLVYLTSTLDYKTQKMYLLTMVATDAGVPPLSASASLNVTVLNVNKGPPVFSQSNFTVYVADNQTVGSIIFTANATDTDFGQNGVVRYSLSPQSTLFSIDPVSGRVNITAQLISQVYVFNLTATDLGTPPFSSRATLTIVVTETNKPPVFLNAVYYIQVYENATIGTTVTQIQASDSGTGANGNVTYSILPPNPFGVDPRTGLVYLISTLDYKTQKMYLLTVVATDAGVPPLSASASLNVTVLNVNKGPPVFSQSNFTVYVADNQTVGSIIFTANATDTDFDQNGVVRYSLSPQSTLFSIDPVSGRVNITAQLISQVYVFNLTATDLGTPPFSSRATLTIVVTETNKPPVFLNAVYYIQVYENATIGTTVTQIQASDSGTGSNGNVTYSILPPNPFGVDPRTGLVYLTSTLDYKTQKMYLLSVVATDAGVPPLSASASLNVTVLNVNKGPPVFSQSNFTVYVADNQTVGSIIFTANATDTDFDQNGVVRYSLSPQSTLFSIDPVSGRVNITAQLISQVYVFNLTATDLGTPPLSSRVTLTIVVTETNKPPVFLNAVYYIQVYENATIGTTVTQVQASDSGIGANGNVTYSIVPPNPFGVDPRTGLVYLISTLDYKTQKMYLLTVVATDAGVPSLSASASLNVTVLNVNKGPPVFSQSNFTVYVADNQTVGSIIFTANATDTDFDHNGVVRYSLSPQSTLFSIDPVSGRVNITAQLISQVYVFNLTATDLGTPPFSSRATLTIVVTETNKPPVFLNAVYYIQVYENATIGTTVTQIQASDSGTGANGNVTYSILPPNPFGVDPRTGLVYLTSTLDYKTQRMYLLTVVATDAGVPPLSASASLNVTVLNVNKGPPVFSQSNFTVYVADNQTVGSIIFTANATDTDFDQNGVVRYSLSPQSTLFSIDPVSGGVNITAQLISQVYVFNLTATDLGTPPLSSRVTLTIVVTETNKPPVFLNAVYYIQVYENATIGTTVTQVQASDSGIGANGNVTYSIVPPNPFGVDPRTGLVYLTSTLDYKTQRMYLLTVVATDAGVPSLSASASLNVTVLNVNKGPPVFSQSNFTVYVADNQTVGSIIFTANATDTDFDQNGVVRYSLSPQSTLFSIDPVSGRVNITAQLIFQVYVFNLTATDLGTPPLLSRATLTIVVMETNKPPVFPNAVYYIQVYENATIGTTVTQVQASDSGTGSNGNVTYSIVPPNPFGVDPRTGLVYLTSTLEYKTQRMYLLTVVATDAGVPPLSASASLNVTVLNVNKGPPVFSQSNFTVYVADNQTVGSIIFTANATDTDFGQNGVVRYFLSPQSTLFSIDPVSGRVNITAQLISQVYVFNLTATDLGTPPLSSRVNLTIVVMETNKPPVFLNAVYYIQVYENATIGTTVTQIQASDSGTGANGNVTYSIVPPNPFGVDPRSGLVYLTSTLDYKTQKMYLLTVVATDAGVPPLSASASLNVTVLNVNKGPPVFSQSNFTVYVADNQTVGSIIFTANATDTDFGQNGVVRYFLSPQSTLFSIDPVSGRVNITAQLISQVYVFNLTATDLGTPPLSSSSTLTIVVSIIVKPKAAPVVLASIPLFTFVEGSCPLYITNVSVSDMDSPTLYNLTISLRSADGITLPLSNATITFANQPFPGLNIANIGGHDITISGNASISVYNGALDSLLYCNAYSEPSLDTLVLIFQASDGLYFSNRVFITITTVPINDVAPIIDLDPGSPGIDYQTVFVQGLYPLYLVAVGANFDDPDGTLGIDTITVTLTNPQDGPLERIDVTYIPMGFRLVEMNASFLLLAGSSTPDDISFMLQSVTYSNVANPPSNPTIVRRVSFKANDGLHDSVVAYTNITIRLINIPPVFTFGGSVNESVVYYENMSSVPLIPANIVLYDQDSVVLYAVNITVIGYLPGVDLLNYSTYGLNITGRFQGGTLSLLGPASVPDFIAVLRSVIYINTYIQDHMLPLLPPGGRTIQFVVSDGSKNSATASAQVIFYAVNNAPVVDLNGPDPGIDFSATFYEGNSSIPVVSPKIIVSDVDSQNLSSARAVLGGASDRDKELLLLGNTSQQIAATFGGGVLNLTGWATPSMYQQLLQSLLYANLLLPPTPGTRAITITVSDGMLDSLPATCYLTVVTFNHVPVLTIVPAGVPYVQSGYPVYLVAPGGVNLTDSDNATLASVTVTVVNAVDGQLEAINVTAQFPDLTVRSALANGSLSYTFSLAAGNVSRYVGLIATLTYSNYAANPKVDARIITVAISDGIGYSLPASLRLAIVLTNKSAIAFPNSTVSVVISELAAVGSVVYTAVATNFGFNYSIAYALQNTYGTFNISLVTGVIALTALLDTRVKSNYTLVIFASDGVNVTSMQLVVTVVAANHPPVFDPATYNSSLLENSPLGAPVTTVRAIDRDTGTNGYVTYNITGGNQNGTFAINATSGAITLAATLDSRIQGSYVISVRATDGGYPSLFSTAIVAVTVVPVKYPPVFAVPVVSLNVSEDTPLFALLYVAQATGRDATDKIVYALASTTQNTFAVNSTGHLVLTGRLNSDVIAQYQLIIVANNTVYISNQTVIVNVVAVDNTPPQFTTAPPFNVSVFDNSSIGTLLLKLEIVNGANSSIEFILPLGNFGGLFALNATSGQLVLNGTLSWETQPFYSLPLVARRTLHPSQNTTALVLITVLDANDMTPTFPYPVYVFSVLENSTVGSIVGIVHATDNNTGPNGMVSYTFTYTSAGSTFWINSSSGEIVLNGTLDRETTPAYWLVVMATDHGTPALSSRTMVNITVLDVNDNSPVFAIPYITVLINEHSSVPTYLTTVHATDKDGGVVLYFLPPENLTLFAVNSTTGVLTAKRAFDSDAGETHFIVVVIATDQGNPPLSSQAIISVNVTDEVEYPPLFPTDQLQLRVPENLPVNSTVAVVMANSTEPGPAGIVVYSLVGVSVSYPFQINPSSGAILLVSRLDRETTPFYIFEVQASNPFEDEFLFSVLFVNVTVLDVNDNAPAVTVSENPVTILTTHPVGALITTVVASDPDLGDNGTVRFALSDSGGYFSISTEGSIFTTAPFLATGNFSLLVTAADLGTPPLATNVTLTVFVVKPVTVAFGQQGAGFLLSQQRDMPTQQFGFFLNAPSGSSGTLFARLGGVEASAVYTTQLPVATQASGVVLTLEVWSDQPSIQVLVKVRDEAGDVHCNSSGVVVRVVPDSQLTSVYDIIPQVSMLWSGGRKGK